MTTDIYDSFNEYVCTNNGKPIIINAVKFAFTAIVSGVDEKTFETKAYPGVFIDPSNNTYYVKGKVGYAGGEQRTILKAGEWLVYQQYAMSPEVIDGSTFASYYKAIPTTMKRYIRKNLSKQTGSESEFVRAYQIQPYPIDKYQEQNEWYKNHPGITTSGHAIWFRLASEGIEVDVYPGNWVAFQYRKLYRIYSDAHFREKFIVPDEAENVNQQAAPYHWPKNELAKTIEDLRNSPTEKQFLPLPEYASVGRIQDTINYLEALKGMTRLANFQI